MEYVALGIAILGILVAIGIPLRVDYEKRPRLRIERGDDSNQTGFPPYWRIVHVRVVSEPIRGWLGKYLLRNLATGCQVRITITSMSDRSKREFNGKWSATPEPLLTLSVGGSLVQVPDAQKIRAAMTLDLSPGGKGEPVAIAIKHDGERQSYAYGMDIYFDAKGRRLRNDSLELPDTKYVVSIRAEAGEITSEALFTLTNNGSSYTGLELLSPV
jgi:hypothetical protein